MTLNCRVGRRAFLARFGPLAFVAGALPLLAGGCGGSSDDDTNSAAAALLRQNRARWARANARAYRYTITLNVFSAVGGVPAVIEVRNGVRTTITPLPSSGQTAPDPEAYAAFDTVEKLFGLIERAINSRAERLDVTYHPTLGYPANFYIDQSRQIADEEIGASVSAFAVEVIS